MILPSSSQKHLRTYHWVRGSWETDRPKSRISSFFSYNKHSLQSKAVIELLHAQNDIAFVVVALFSPFVCKLARVAVLASCGLAKLNTTSFWATQEVDTCAYCACAVHMQTQFTTLCLWLSIWHLGGICPDLWRRGSLSWPSLGPIPSLNSTLFYWDGTEAE